MLKLAKKDVLLLDQPLQLLVMGLAPLAGLGQSDEPKSRGAVLVLDDVRPGIDGHCAAGLVDLEGSDIFLLARDGFAQAAQVALGTALAR